MAAHINRCLLRGKWVAGQSVRCCFPVFGKELTVSFALALGRFFSSKGCQIERFIFSGTSIKGLVAESAKTSRFWPRKRMDCWSLLRSLWEIDMVATSTAFSCLRVHWLQEDFSTAQGDSSEVDWSVSMTSQGIVSVEWQLCMLLTMMTVMPACCNVCFFYFFFILSVFFLSMIWGFCSSLPL